MRKTIRLAALIAALICTTLPAVAATPGEFYGSLLRRGVAAFDAGRLDEATQHLRLAAFGFIENIEQYQTAHAYLAATYDRLGQADRARDSVRRLAQAERIQPRFAALKLPGAIRTTVEKLATGVLTPAELAGIRGTASMPPAPPPQQPVTRTTSATPTPTTTTTTTTNPPAVVERVEVEEVKPAPVQTQAGTNHNPPPDPRPATTTPAVTTTPATTTPATTTATTTRPAPVQQQPTVTLPRPATTYTYTAAERAARFTAAERALDKNNLPEARRVYAELLASQGLDRDAYIRLAEGLYRARNFAGALTAFERAGGLRGGEEPYRYYIAVALYETGQYERARRELASALPYIEITPDVARYRTKIQSAIQ
jgi:tetratricopeptide (TPR) repeat protein